MDKKVDVLKAAEQFRYFFPVLLITFFVFPFLEGIKDEVMMLSIVFLIVIISTFKLLGIKMRILLFFIGIQVLIISMGGIIFPHISHEIRRNLDVIPLITYAGFLSYSLAIMIRKIFETSKVTINLISLGISIYLMIGFLWTLFYYIILHYDINAFHYTAPREDVYLMYYSFTTLTTVGYGDIFPVNKFAMTFSNIEAILGQIYLSIFIARLVGMHIVHEINNKEKKSF